VSKQKPYLSDLIGVPFEFGKTDCWWLAREVFKRYRIEIPKYLVSQATFSLDNDLSRMREIIIEKQNEWTEHKKPPVPCAIAMQFGLPFYHHVGVYIGKNKFIHTSSVRGGVTIENLDNPLYAKRKFYTFNSD
jgi:cell wall-associated NlpC family hydrolase